MRKHLNLYATTQIKKTNNKNSKRNNEQPGQLMATKSQNATSDFSLYKRCMLSI